MASAGNGGVGNGSMTSWASSSQYQYKAIRQFHKKPGSLGFLFRRPSSQKTEREFPDELYEDRSYCY